MTTRIIQLPYGCSAPESLIRAVAAAKTPKAYTRAVRAFTRHIAPGLAAYLDKLPLWSDSFTGRVPEIAPKDIPSELLCAYDLPSGLTGFPPLDEIVEESR